MADDYVELAGRTLRKEPTRWVWQTRGVATLVTDSLAPQIGDADLVITPISARTVPAICVAAQTDEARYPKRIVFNAIWESPTARSEL